MQGLARIRTQSLLVLLVSALLIPVSPAFDATQAFAFDDEFAKRLHAGTEEARLGNYSAAMADLQSAVALDAGNPEGWYQLGLLLGQLADFRGAEVAFRHALKLKPEFAQAHYNLGLTLVANPQSKLDWPGAIAEMREALKSQPDFADAHNLLGAGLTNEGEFDAAIQELQQAVHLKPSLPEAHFNLAIALEKNERLEDAAKEYQAAVSIKGTYPEASTALGELLFGMGRTPEAEQELKIALSLNPDSVDAHHALASVMQFLGKKREATIELMVAKELSQRTVDAMRSSHLSNQGLELASKGDLSVATVTLRQAVAAKPDYGVPHYNLGLVLADEGDLQGAYWEFAKSISLMPGQPKPWIQMGRVLSRRGDLHGALHALTWASRLSPPDQSIRSEMESLQASAAALNSAAKSAESVEAAPFDGVADTPQAHLAFANELAAQHDYSGAIGELLRILLLRPAFTTARQQLAGAYLKIGEGDHAIVEYYKILCIEPDSVETRVSLGDVLFDKGEGKQAVEEFRIALRYKPDSADIQTRLDRALKLTAQP